MRRAYKPSEKQTKLEQTVISCFKHVTVSSIGRMMNLSYSKVYSIIKKHDLEIFISKKRTYPYERKTKNKQN